MNRIKLFVPFIVSVLFYTLYSQVIFAQDNTMYFMEIHPQSNLLNPAQQYNYSVVIFSPSTNSYFENSSLSLNDLIEKRKVGGTTEYYWDFENIEKSLHVSNTVNSKISFNPIFLGLKLKNGWYASFSASLKNNSLLKYPGTITDIRFGNADLATLKPRTIDLNNYAINELSYGELSFGVSKQFGEKLFIGTHVKILLGLSAIKTNRFLAEINTSDDFSSTVLKTDILMDVSGTLLNTDKVENVFKLNKKFGDFVVGKEALSLKNNGMAVDIGFIYKANARLGFYGTVNDFGFINWKSEPQQVVSNNEYLFNGFHFTSQTFKDGFILKDYLKAYGDSIVSTMIPSLKNENFKTRLFTKIYLGTKYELSTKYSISFLVKSIFYYDSPLLKSTLGFNWTPNKKVALTGTWSYNNYSLYNFGIGALFNLKRFQFYAVSDNINIVDIQNSRALNFALGINFRMVPWHLNSEKRN